MLVEELMGWVKTWEHLLQMIEKLQENMIERMNHVTSQIKEGLEEKVAHTTDRNREAEW